MPVRAILAALLVAFCWGGNFAASKFAMMEFPPFEVVILRFSGLVVLLAPFALRLPRPRMRDMLIIAMTLIVLHFAMIFVAMQHGLTITSVIVATQMGVPFSCVVSAILFKDFLGPWRSAGLTVAFCGVLVVAGTPNASLHWSAFLLAIFGAFSWSSANIYMKRMKPVPVIGLLFWPGLLALVPLVLLSAIFEHDQWTHIQQAPLASWLGIAYSITCSSLVGYGLWNWLISKYPLSQVVPYSLCVPFAGITAGVLMFDEPLTLQIVLGAALTMLGVAVITVRRPKLAELEQ